MCIARSQDRGRGARTAFAEIRKSVIAILIRSKKGRPVYRNAPYAR
jgi:hypothetical protein